MSYDYRKTSEALKMHLATVEEKTGLVLVMIRERPGKEGEALAECDAAEKDLECLLFSCSLASNWPAVQRFAHHPESVFFADEAKKFGDALWKRLSGLADDVRSRSADKRSRKSLGKGLTALRKSLNQAMRCMRDLANIVPQEYRKRRTSRRRLGIKLIHATVATTQYLRMNMESDRATLELCDALEEHLIGIHPADGNAAWTPFMDAFRALLAGPEANTLEKMSTKNDEFYYEIPRLLLELMGKEAAK